MLYHFYPKRIFRIRFCVENSKSDKTECDICKEKLQKGEIRIVHQKVMVKSEYFHLNCYNPKFKQFISLEDIKVDLTSTSKSIFEEWLAAWNANYFPLDQSLYCPVLSSQQKLDTRIQNRRIYLEVFKFLSVSDLFQSLFRVNKNFYTLTWDKELWEFLLVRDFDHFEQNLNANELKTIYVTCFYYNCIECKQRPSDQSFNRCPLLKKTLCKECLKKDKFTLINKTEILRVYGINSDLVKVAWWTEDGNNRVTYRVLFEDELMLFRREQKKKVLEFLNNFCNNINVIQSFENLDITLMDLKVRDPKFVDLVNWKPNYSMVLKGSLFEKLFEFIRKGKNLNMDKLIGNKELIRSNAVSLE